MFFSHHYLVARLVLIYLAFPPASGYAAAVMYHEFPEETVEWKRVRE